MHNNATFRVLFSLFLLSLSINLSAQEQTGGEMRSLGLSALQALTVDPTHQTLTLTFNIQFNKAPSPFIAAYVHFPATDNGSASIRWSADGSQWSEWETCRRDPHTSDETVTACVPLFLDKSAKKVALHLQGEVAAAFQKDHKNAKLLLFNPEMPAVNDVVKPIQTASQERGANCGNPDIQPRSVWNAPTLPATCQTRTNVTHLIVHHSATSNTSANWAATVLAIWRGHIDRAFCDVGYNYLIDPNGVIYEGRVAPDALNIQGAHFCGTNSNTMGVCLLGDYTNVQPTEATLNSLVQLLTWRSTNLGIDVIGTLFHHSSGLTLNRISGHRDGSCATSCPGNMNYPLLPQIRERVKNCTNLVSVKDAASLIDQFNVTPNPTAGLFTIQLALRQPHPVLIRVYNNLGQLVHSTDATQPADWFRTDIDLSEQTPGFYYVRAWIGDREVSRRLVIN
jgi:N-acetylmuramoyl-L-alanine amidase/Secretion system C-terminal sorting domain